MKCLHYVAAHLLSQVFATISAEKYKTNNLSFVGEKDTVKKKQIHTIVVPSSRPIQHCSDS